MNTTELTPEIISWIEAHQKDNQDITSALADAYKSVLDNVLPCPGRTKALNMIFDVLILATQQLLIKESIKGIQ